MTFWRRLIAGLCDVFILVSWLMLATFIAILIHHGESFPAHHLGFSAYLLAMSFILLGWCWTHGGQTLGMLAWNIKVLRQDGGKLTWKDAMLRFIFLTLNCLCLGLGWLWCWVDKDHQSLHDRLSSTKLVSAKPEIK